MPICRRWRDRLSRGRLLLAQGVAPTAFRLAGEGGDVPTPACAPPSSLLPSAPCRRPCELFLGQGRNVPCAPPSCPVSSFLASDRGREAKTSAGVAELADAYGSGPYGGNPMKVQVLSPAPFDLKRNPGQLLGVSFFSSPCSLFALPSGNEPAASYRTSNKDMASVSAIRHLRVTIACCPRSGAYRGVRVARLSFPPLV